MKKRDYLDGIFELAQEIKEIREGSPVDPSPSKVTPKESSPEGDSPETISPEPDSPEIDSAETYSAEGVSPETASPERVSGHRRAPDGHRDIRRNFVKVDAGVLDVAIGELGPFTGMVYLRLYRLSYGWRRNTCRATVQALAEACGMTDRTVRTAVSKLVADGYIERETDTRRNAGGNLYRVFLPSEIPALAAKCAKRLGRSAENASPEGVSPEIDSAELVSGTPENASPELVSGQSADAPLPAAQVSPENASPEGVSAIIDSTSTIDNNNIEELAVVLRSAGFVVDNARVAQWIAAGITEDRVRECIAYVRKQQNLRNPAGALITAIEDGWEIDEQTRRETAVARAVQSQRERDEREKEETARWLQEEKEHMGLEALSLLREQTREMCQKDPGYQAQPNRRMQDAYVEHHVNEILLMRRARRL